MRRTAAEATIVRRLVHENGRRLLRGLDPAVPDWLLDAANETMIQGVVLYRGHTV